MTKLAMDTKLYAFLVGIVSSQADLLFVMNKNNTETMSGLKAWENLEAHFLSKNNGGAIALIKAFSALNSRKELIARQRRGKSEFKVLYAKAESIVEELLTYVDPNNVAKEIASLMLLTTLSSIGSFASSSELRTILAGNRKSLHTGCTRTITANRDASIEFYNLPDKRRIEVAGGTHLTVTQGGVALFEVPTTDGKVTQIRLMADYCPAMKSTLISTSDLLAQGYDIHLRQLIMDTPSTEQIQLGSYHGSPTLTFSTKQQALAVTTTQVNNKDWLTLHLRLGHPNPIRMSHTLGVPVSKIKFRCPQCMLANIKTRPVPQGPHEDRSYKPQQAATLDVVGPMPVDGLPKNIRYVLIARDLASDIAQPYGMTTPSEVSIALKRWRADWHGYEKRPARLYVDGAKYFLHGEFRRLCDEWDWTLSISPSGAHALHPAESINGTFLRLTRVLLRTAQLPDKFWWLAYQHAAYLRNRLCTQRHRISPYERHYGKPPSLDHLHIFGSDVVFKNQSPPNKLTPRGLRGLYLGPAREYNYDTHLILTRDTKRFVVSRDVVFYDDFITNRVLNCFEDPLNSGPLTSPALSRTPHDTSDTNNWVDVSNSTNLTPSSVTPLGANRPTINTSSNSTVTASPLEHTAQALPPDKDGMTSQSPLNILSPTLNEPILSSPLLSRRATSAVMLMNEKPDFANPGADDSEKPDFANPGSDDYENPDFVSDDYENPDFVSDDYENPDFVSDDYENPDFARVEADAYESHRSTNDQNTLLRAPSHNAGDENDADDNDDDYKPSQEPIITTGIRRSSRTRIPVTRINIDAETAFGAANRHTYSALNIPVTRMGEQSQPDFSGMGERVSMTHTQHGTKRPRSDGAFHASRQGENLTNSVKQKTNNSNVMQTAQNSIMRLTPNITVPKTYKEFTRMKPEDQEPWIEAIRKEWSNLERSGTFLLVPRSTATTGTMGARWVFTYKEIEDIAKAQLVVQGFDEPLESKVDVYAPTSDRLTLRTALVVALTRNWATAVLDVSAAFLQAEIDHDNENIFVEPPEGVTVPDGHVYKLARSLYGLRTSPRRWSQHLSKTLCDSGLRKSKFDPSCYMNDNSIIITHVDDLFIFGTTNAVRNTVQALMNKYEVKVQHNPEEVYYLGLKFKYNRQDKVCTISQEKFAAKILETSGMSNANFTKTPLEKGCSLPDHPIEEQHRDYRSILGKLLYLGQTRIDLAFALHQVSRHGHKNGDIHMHALKRIMRYIKGTQEYGLTLRGHTSEQDLQINVFADASYAAVEDPHLKSVSGYVIRINDSAVLWKSTRQSMIALSTLEAEMMSIHEATRAAIGVKNFLHELGVNTGVIHIYTDSQSLVDVLNRGHWNDRNKHLALKYLSLSVLQEEGKIKVYHIPGQLNPSDCLTKSLPIEPHWRHSDTLMKAQPADLGGVLRRNSDTSLRHDFARLRGAPI